MISDGAAGEVEGVQEWELSQQFYSCVRDVLAEGEREVGEGGTGWGEPQ